MQIAHVIVDQYHKASNLPIEYRTESIVRASAGKSAFRFRVQIATANAYENADKYAAIARCGILQRAYIIPVT